MHNIIRPNSIVSSLLKAREERWQNKLALAKHGWHIVSLQLNIPGYPKSDESTEQFIKLIDQQFVRFLNAHAPSKYKGEKKSFIDKAGECIYYLIPAKGIISQELKDLTERFEERHQLGRIIDLDVLDSKGKAISSGKAKACFMCDQPAYVCRKNNNHAIEHVRKFMLDAIKVYLEGERLNNCIERLSTLVIKALLYEVSLSPKPGLVCRNSAGAHTDMDFLSFVNSTSALAPYFNQIGQLAAYYKGNNLIECLPQIREIGLKMEDVMFEATDNVNTHKGAIFLMAISMFSAVRVLMKKKKFKTSLFSSMIQQLTRGMIQRELCSIEEGVKMTHGEACFMQYGLQGAGARGEAEQGLPTVMHHALPFVKELQISLESLKDKDMFFTLAPVLLKIMSINNDTNVLFRHGKDVLEELKAKSALALEQIKEKNTEPYTQLVQWCNSNKISPGGSADLLSVTLFLQFCQTDKGL